MHAALQSGLQSTNNDLQSTTPLCTMYKAVLALAASAGAFAPSVHQRATVVQQGVPLANGAMEFDRMQPASGIDRCAATTCIADARAHACHKQHTTTQVCAGERRCKYEGDKATSASLEACSKVLDEYLPELKKIDGVTVKRDGELNCRCCCVSLNGATRSRRERVIVDRPPRHRSDAVEPPVNTRAGLACGGCLDFKVMVTQPLEATAPGGGWRPPAGGGLHRQAQGDPRRVPGRDATITNMVLQRAPH